MWLYWAPRQSRANQRASATSKNLQEFAYRCVSLCPFRAEGRPKSHPSTHARNFCVTPFPSFFFACVCVMCVRIYCSRVLRFALRDLPSTNLQLLDSVIDFLHGPSSCLVLRWISCPTRARPAVSPGHPIICLFYMPLMSILRLAVFLSLWSLKIQRKQLGQSVMYGAIRSKRERSPNCNETMFS